MTVEACEAPRSSNSELVVPVKRTFIHYETRKKFLGCFCGMEKTCSMGSSSQKPSFSLEKNFGSPYRLFSFFVSVFSMSNFQGYGEPRGVSASPKRAPCRHDICAFFSGIQCINRTYLRR